MAPSPMRSHGDAPPLMLSIFPSFAVGGAQVRFARLANHFGPALRHAIIAMDGRRDCAVRLRPDLDVSYPEVAIRKGAMLANARTFRGVLRTLRPDLLVTSNWGSIEWALANLPGLVRHIHTEDGFGPEERTRQLPRRVLFRRLLLRRSEVMLPSRTLLRLATEVWKLPPRRLHYIPNGIDLARFTPAHRAGTGADPAAPPGADQRADRHGPGAAGPPLDGARGPVIGTVAALRPEKNLARLLRAFRQLPAASGATLAIIGDGAERPGLEALAAELGVRDRVRFAGHVEDPSGAYAGFDLFALSSDTEQMPISVLEAMAAGLPVVSTDVGDVRAMLAAENAPCVVPLDDGALAGALQALVEDAGHRQLVGAANRAKAERDYDEAGMFRAYAALFGLPTLA